MALTQISTAGVKDDAVTSGKIPANAVGSSELADNAVDTAAIQNDAVTSSKLASNAVTNAKIGNNAIGDSKIATGAVTTAKIADDAVTQAKIAANAVDSTELADGGVTTAKIADGGVTTAKIANSAITSSKLASSSVDSNALGSQVVVTANIADDAVTADKLASGVQTTINGNNDHYIITGTGTANTLSGDSSAQWNGTSLTLDKSTNAYLNPDLNLYNSYNGGWGGGISFSAKYSGNKETQARIRTYGGSHANDASLAFETGNPNEVIRMLPTGGFTFNGDTSTNNALKDYEIGTWTPTLAKAGATGSADSQVNNRFGFYTKVGDLLWISFYWYSTDLSFGTGGNAWYIDGLPYNLLTNQGSAYQFIPGGYLYQNGHTGVSYQAGYRWQSNSTNGPDTITMYGQGNTSNASGGPYEFSGTGCLRVS